MEKALLSLCWTIWYGMKTKLNKIQITEHLKFFEGFSRNFLQKVPLNGVWGKARAYLSYKTIAGDFLPMTGMG